MSMSQRVSLVAKMLSVVHAIQPAPESSGTNENFAPVMRKGMSCTPTVKSGRSRCGEGELGERVWKVERGMLERIDML